jgi:Fe-S cluster assembly protein SufD
LVFVNGRFAPEISHPVLPAGVVVLSLAEALARRPELVEPHLGKHAAVDATPFTALNAAFIQDGAFVLVPAGLEARDSGAILFHHHRRSAETRDPSPQSDRGGGRGPGGSHRVVPRRRRPAYLTNAVTEVILGAHAWLEHSRIQREAESAPHRLQSCASGAGEPLPLLLARDGRGHQPAQPAYPARRARHRGAALRTDDRRRHQLADNHTAIYHSEPNCRSWEVYKAILDGESRGVFNGKVFVTPEAQKTDAKQTNRTLLLSERARVDTKPQLEIFADDVKCTHGATVGYLDDLPLFYFRSRGIPEENARQLLTYAFAAEVLDEIHVEPVRLALEALVRERLGVRS